MPRSDAIQSFVTQETPIVRIRCDDGSEGTGYSYTIGTGGSSVVALLRDHLAPRLIGRDPAQIEAIWRDLLFATHATCVGAITSLALAAIDTALWDWRCRRDGQPLWRAAGGAQAAHSGLHDRRRLAAPDARRAGARSGRRAGGRLSSGAKIKVGKPHVSEDVARLRAVREAVGDGFELMVDANQCFSARRGAAARAALRRARHRLVRGAAAGRRHRRPRAAGGGERGADRGRRIAVLAGAVRRLRAAAAPARIVQVDVARIGGITPWLKVAHLAEAFNLAVCPHFLMELHVSLCAAVPNAAWVEYIPQLDAVATSRVRIERRPWRGARHAGPGHRVATGDEIERRARRATIDCH